jgi:hypothetical protein
MARHSAAMPLPTFCAIDPFVQFLSTLHHFITVPADKELG